MSVTLYTPSPFVHSTLKSQWRDEHPNRIEYSEIPENPQLPHKSLFAQGTPGVLLEMESMTAPQIRQFCYSYGENDADILIVLDTPSKTQFSKDGFTVLSDKTTTNSRQGVVKGLQNHFGLPQSSAQYCYDEGDQGGKLTYVYAHQASLLPQCIKPNGKLYNPWVNKTPPWALIDALVAGDTPLAVTTVKNLITNGADATALFFQITGVITKTISAKHDTGDIVSSKMNYYAPKAQRLVNPEKATRAVATYSESILNSKTKNYVLCAYVTDLSICFR